MRHINSTFSSTLYPYYFEYWSNNAIINTILNALDSALTHLETKEPYVKVLFIDFSSAFNTIIP